jgi:hypothetical protein
MPAGERPDRLAAQCSAPANRFALLHAAVLWRIRLMIARRDGSNPRQLTHTPGCDGGRFFSADGQRVRVNVIPEARK